MQYITLNPNPTHVFFPSGFCARTTISRGKYMHTNAHKSTLNIWSRMLQKSDINPGSNLLQLKLYIGQQGSRGGALACNPKQWLRRRKYLIWSCKWDYCRDCMSRERQPCRTPSPQRLRSKQWGRRKTHWRPISVHLRIQRGERRTGV